MSPESKRRVDSCIFYATYVLLAVFVVLCCIPGIHLVRHPARWIVWSVLAATWFGVRFGRTSRGKMLFTLGSSLVALAAAVLLLWSSLFVLAVVPALLIFLVLFVSIAKQRPRQYSSQPQ